MIRFFSTLPAKTLPRLPEAPPARIAAFVLNRLAPRLWQDEDFAWLAGRAIRIALVEPAIGITLGHDGRHFVPMQQAADVTLRAGWQDFLAMIRQEADPDTLFFQRRLQIDGDTELGLHLKNWLDATDWDALRSVLPGPAAHWLSPRA
ncbi:putative lipid carrier protein YhbT [Silvimonas terrae]|uniref:Putative lipid carrier protein YhbT n=1 Tax=Silvimonas terrae TaxID=300266 RepID=A0A840RH36_9NEIS|nr:SCP2 sterol-binding domain-containing protein [Silvimonas terrae]MBB5192377.1 putative lipid carrier protein YhbT [Silvimonas terrae]